MRKMMTSAAAVAMLGASPMAAAEMGVGVKAGTLGGGVEFGIGLNDSFSARLGLNKYDKSDDQTIDGIDYSAELELSSTTLYLDWHPMQGSFRVTAGYLISDNKLVANATPSSSVEIGGQYYEPADIGQINASAALGDGPYLGIGWGNVPASGFGVTVDLGVVSMGKPNVDLNIDDPNGVIAANNDIEKERANIENDLDDYDMYPVISLGLSYGF
ncbi:MAG TPA: hypothetical protein VIQ22_01075 [Gammaproteobacteria bacterium]